jgi:hypothetical protein
METGKWVKIVAVVVVCVLFDIALHHVTNAYSTMPENPN